MKKIIYQGALIGLLFISLSQLTMAQSAVTPPPPVPPVSKEAPADKGEQREIIIRQKGDKDKKLTLEIKNGEYFINGKPLDKYEDKDVIIERRDVDEDVVVVPEIAYGPSPFRMDPADRNKIQMEVERSQRDMKRDMETGDMQRRIQKSIQIHMNSAFLGVSSRKAEKGGATVLEVTKGSPAEKAGILKGDIITKVNDAKIESPENLFETVHNYKPGEKVKIFFTRNGKEQNVTATLEKGDLNNKNFNYNYHYNMPPMPPMPGMGDMHMGPWGEQPPKLGIKAQDAEDGKGVNILEVEDSSVAAKAGLKKGDIILKFDGESVNSTNELVDQLDEARQKSSIKVSILRSGAPQELEIKIPRKLKTAEL